MKLAALLLATSALAGCGIVLEGEILAGAKACEPHGGLKAMYFTKSAALFDALCKDGTNIMGRVKEQ